MDAKSPKVSKQQSSFLPFTVVIALTMRVMNIQWDMSSKISRVLRHILCLRYCSSLERTNSTHTCVDDVTAETSTRLALKPANFFFFFPAFFFLAKNAAVSATSAMVGSELFLCGQISRERRCVAFDKMARQSARSQAY